MADLQDLPLEVSNLTVFPALVGVHGGGWVQGVRGQFQHWGKYLAARGIALFAISYRLAKPGQKTFPHAVQDVLAGIQFARARNRPFVAT